MDKTELTVNEFEQHFLQKYGPVRGYLPQDAAHIREWLSNLVNEAHKEKEALGDAYIFHPSIIAMRNYLGSHLLLKLQVETMIAEGHKIHLKHGPPYTVPPFIMPYIKTLDALYIVLNYQITRAPIFAPNIPHSGFPMSGIFVYMMYSQAGWFVFRDPNFNDLLRNILDAWCTFLDSPESLYVVTTDPEGWLSPESVIKNDLNEFVTPEQKKADPIHWGFKSFNDYFHRNIIPSYRPIQGLGNQSIIVSANDGTVNRLARDVKRKTDFTIKSQPYSLENMLNFSPYVDRFVGGDVLQSFLSGNNYHRWHAPISGTVVDMQIVPAFMFSELRSEGFDPSAGTLSQEYEANVNTRALIFIESDNPTIGMVCVMPIGITEISSIQFNDQIHVGAKVYKGQLLGRFSYGGSSLCLIFQKGAIATFTKGTVNDPLKVNAQVAVANVATSNNSSGYESSTSAIEHIINRANTDTSFHDLLLESLNKAKQASSTEMNPDLYNALSWPTTIAGYELFLIEFARWMPQQSNLPAWKDPATGNAQEVYDRLCHFYWLIDQPVGPDNNTIVQSIEGFDQWLVWYANAWGDFLNTPESFNNDILQTFIKDSPKFRVQDSMINGRPNNPSGWLTFNQFFARELNPGLRPIANPMDNHTITTPADCTYRNHFPIADDSTIHEIVVKKTHKFARIQDLLKGSKHKDAFGGGTYVHYFLGPYSYHRFHTPVSGIVDECYAIQGFTYLEVNLAAPQSGESCDTPTKNKQFDAPDNADGGYEFSQARGVITIDTTNSPYGNVGIVAIIPVGMCQVSSVNMTATPQSHTLKGDEFGYFLFGGSDIIMLFQKGVDVKIATEKLYRLYGSDISVAPPVEE